MIASANILLVEDDENLCFLIKDYLDSHGWNVNVYGDGEKGLSAFRSHAFDLCILDVMLPSKDGFDLAGEIRKYNQKIPIVFLTARSQTEDRIRGFKAGADDYVCKPFSIEEFRYRIEAVLKRSGNQLSFQKDQPELKAGKSILDINNLKLNANGLVIQLTYKEARLLDLFFRNTNKLLERDLFLKTIWEEDGFFVARSMDVFVSRIRKYLREDATLRIENVRGVGYIMKETDAPAINKEVSR
jgi:two-component system, OmpR family, response regulator